MKKEQNYIKENIFRLINTLSNMMSNHIGYESTLVKELLQKIVEDIKISCRINNVSCDEQIANQVFLTNRDKHHPKYFTSAIIKSCNRIIETIPKNIDETTGIKVLYFMYNYVNEILHDLSRLNVIENSCCKTDCLYAEEAYNASVDLLWNTTSIRKPSIVPVTQSSVFLIRQSIELKLYGILGISDIHHANSSVKIKLLDLFKFIDKNNQIKWEFKLSKSNLEKIILWTNDYVHNGVISSLWLIETAQYFIKDLFKSNQDDFLVQLNKLCNEASFSDTQTIPYSIHCSVKIGKEYYNNKLRVDFINYLISENPKLKEGKVKIIVKSRPECMLI